MLFKTITLIAVSAVLVLSSRADPEWLPLWENGTPGPLVGGQDEHGERGRLTRIARPEIQVWPAPGVDGPAPALVVLPGGGYQFLAMNHEGRRIPAWANRLGMTAVVVKYRVSNQPEDGYHAPWPMVDAHRAVATVRHNAERWKIDPARIGIIGFSAGGHLAAMVTTDKSAPPREEWDEIDRTSSRPDFAMLIYPVIAMDAGHGHAGSRNSLLPGVDDLEVLARHNPAKQVGPHVPPLFLVHANDDAIVPPQNSKDMESAAQLAGVPVEFHLYPNGGHGFGLGRGRKGSGTWPDTAAAWLRGRGILK